MTDHLHLNPIRCDAYGMCAELLPELIELDDWGYPIIEGRALTPELAKRARQAVNLCPRLALSVEQRGEQVARRPARRLALLGGRS